MKKTLKEKRRRRGRNADERDVQLQRIATLRQFRETMNIPLRAVSVKLEINHSTLCRYENGEIGRIKNRFLDDWAQVLNELARERALEAQ